MPTISSVASFKLEDATIEELIGFEAPGASSITLFEDNDIRRSGEFGVGLGPFDTISFDYAYDLNLGLDVVFERFSLGGLTVDYPLDLDLVLPEDIQPGEVFRVGTSDLFDVNGASVVGESFSIGNVGLDLRFSSEGAELTDFALLEIGETNLINLPISDLQFSSFDERTFRLVEFDLSLGQSQEIIDGVEVEVFAVPGGGSASSDAVTLTEQSTLPTLTVSTRDPLAQVTANPIELLDSFPAFAALDFLTEDFGPYSLPGGYELEFDYTLLAPFIAAGFGIVQEFVFTPTNVKTNIDIGGTRFEGQLGESFDFVAPTNLSDPLLGTVTYDLEGDVSVAYRLAPIGSVGVEILSASATLLDSSGFGTSSEIGPLLDLSLEGSADAFGLTLFESGPIPVPDRFFEPISFNFELAQQENTLSFVQDFVVGTTQDTSISFDLLRTGDVSFPLTVFVDGEITEGDATFGDFEFTFEPGPNPELIIPASVSEVFGDVAGPIELSIVPTGPESETVRILDGTANVLLIGDFVDSRGGAAFGDPHLLSFDNVAFDFQAAGDFVLTRATAGPEYEVQARFSAISSAVSVTHAMATSLSDMTVSVEVNGDAGLILIDGIERSLDDGGSLAIGTGSILRAGQSYVIDHGNGDFTDVDVFSTFLNVSPRPNEARERGSLEGLLGNANGTPADDFRLTDGTILTTPLSVDMLYGEFAESWLVSGSDNLLPGETETFSAPGRILTIDSLPTQLRLTAEAAVDANGISNPILREAAVLDFALTGNMEFIEAAALIDQKFDPIVDTVPIDPVNNPAIVLTGSSNLINEEEPAERSPEFTVSRGSTEGDLLVNFSLSGIGDNPTETNDFVNGVTTGSVVIFDGDETARFVVDIADDEFLEGPETFSVLISLDPTRSEDFELLVSEVPVTIVDDDAAPVSNEIVGTNARDSLVGSSTNDTFVFNGGFGDVARGNSGDDTFDLSANIANGVQDFTRILDWSADKLVGLTLDDVHTDTMRISETGWRFSYGDDYDVLTVTGTLTTNSGMLLTAPDAMFYHFDIA